MPIPFAELMDRLKTLGVGDCIVDLEDRVVYANVGGRLCTLTIVGVNGPDPDKRPS